MLDLHALLALRHDTVGVTLRQKRIIDLVEQVLADMPDPAGYWRRLADQQTDLGAAGRMRAVAELVEALQW